MNNFYVSLYKLTSYVFIDIIDLMYLDVCFQEHFFAESNGQTGYIQDRLKRIRRSLAPEAQQRPRSHNKQATNKEAATYQPDAGKKLSTVSAVRFLFKTDMFFGCGYDT